MIKTVICYNVPGFVVVFDNRVVSLSVYSICRLKKNQPTTPTRVGDGGV